MMINNNSIRIIVRVWHQHLGRAPAAVRRHAVGPARALLQEWYNNNKKKKNR